MDAWLFGGDQERMLHRALTARSPTTKHRSCMPQSHDAHMHTLNEQSHDAHASPRASGALLLDTVRSQVPRTRLQAVPLRR
jgi:hypothetical protein